MVSQRAGAACARPLKGGVWPSLPANASDRKDSFSTATGAHIDRVHQPTRAKKMVGQILHSRGKQLLPPFFTVPDRQRGGSDDSGGKSEEATAAADSTPIHGILTEAAPT